MIWRLLPFWQLSAVFTRKAARSFSPLVGLRIHPNGWPVLPPRESYRRRSLRLSSHKLPRFSSGQVGEYRATYSKESAKSPKP